MKVIYSKDNKSLDFGDENLEEFVQTLDKQDPDAEVKFGNYWDELQNKRIFYVLKPNCGHNLIKIGIAHAPTSRLKTYYNHYGKNEPLTNKCSGMKVLLILGTQKNYGNDKRTKYVDFDVNKLEKFVKTELKERNLIIRGTEWANVSETELEEIIKKHVITSQRNNNITPVKLPTRFQNNIRYQRNRSGLIR